MVVNILLLVVTLIVGLVYMTLLLMQHHFRLSTIVKQLQFEQICFVLDVTI
jgi:hypothetical protein